MQATAIQRAFRNAAGSLPATPQHIQAVPLSVPPLCSPDEQLHSDGNASASGAAEKEGTSEPSPRTFRSERMKPCVLDTRPASSQSFTAALEQSGINVLNIPMIRIESAALNEDIEAALHNLPSFDGLLLTSMNAVRAFATLLREAGIEAERLPPVFVVGPRTAEEARNVGFAPQSLPSSSYGATLAAELPDVRDRRFLQPCSDIAREEIADGIRARGGEIQQLVVYRTLPPSQEDARRLRESAERQAYDYVSFFSPSAVRHFAALLPEAQRHAAIVAVIGDTTGAEAETLGMNVHIVAREQHSSAMAEAIVAWHESRNSDDTAAETTSRRQPMPSSHGGTDDSSMDTNS